ncbi:MAG: hypothetical protein U0P30_10790 [Vicinamibacterales bacterium]
MTQRRSRLSALLILAACLGLVATPAMAQVAPGAPTNLQAVVSGNTLNLSWSAPSSGGAPTAYTLVVRTAPGGPVLTGIPLGNVTSFAAVGPNGTFVISVQASNAGGAGAESGSVTVVLPTVPAPPGPPSGLVAGASGNTATFTWNPPSSGGAVQTYLLAAGLTPGFALPIATLPLPGTSTSAVVPGVPAGTFYIRVVAQNAGGVSAPTNEAVLTVAGPAAPGAPTLLQPVGPSGNTLNLAWTPGGGGVPTSYVLTALTTGGAVIASVPLTGTSVSFPNVPNGTYVLQIAAVNAVGTSPASNAITVTLPLNGPPPPITQIGPDITSPDGNFGYRVALSANGQRVVVGAQSTANGTTRVYERSGSTWVQLGGDILGEAADDRAGAAVDINAAGTRIAVGAYLNDGVAPAAGHVRIYDLIGSTWTQVGSDLDGGGNSWGAGYSVALSGDGSRVVVGAPGVNTVTGRVRVYEYSGGTWNALGSTLQGSNQFGTSVDISADGSTIAASFPSAAGLSRAGTVQVYRLSAGNWTPLGNLLQGEQIADNFGDALALSANGTRLAVAAPSDDEGGVAAGGAPSGKLRVFELAGGTWTQLGNDMLGVGGQRLGEAIGFSDDGQRLIGSAASFSLAKVYRLSAGAWTQIGGDVKTANGIRNAGVAIAADGNTVALGFVNGSPRRVSVFSVTP